MERPAMRLSGPCVEAPDVPAPVRFYERFLGWEVEELVGPRDAARRVGGGGGFGPRTRRPYDERYGAPCRCPRPASAFPDGLFLPVIGIAAIGLGLIAIASSRRAAGGR